MWDKSPRRFLNSKGESNSDRARPSKQQQFQRAHSHQSTKPSCYSSFLVEPSENPTTIDGTRQIVCQSRHTIDRQVADIDSQGQILALTRAIFSASFPFPLGGGSRNRQEIKVGRQMQGYLKSNSHGARPVHLLITMRKWIRTSRLSIKNSLSR